MRQKFSAARLFSITGVLLGLAFQTGCADDPECLGPQCCDGVDEGEERCAGTVRERCDGERWTTIANCTPERCFPVGSVTTCLARECTEGAQRCADNRIETCVNGAWSSADAVNCGLDRCRETSGVASCVADPCDFDEFEVSASFIEVDDQILPSMRIYAEEDGGETALVLDVTNFFAESPTLDGIKNAPGVGLTATELGPVTLAGRERNYRTCSLCVRGFYIDADDNVFEFMADAGSVSAASLATVPGANASFTLTNVVLVESIFNVRTFDSTPIPGGLRWCLPTTTIAGTTRGLACAADDDGLGFCVQAEQSQTGVAFATRCENRRLVDSTACPDTQCTVVNGEVASCLTSRDPSGAFCGPSALGSGYCDGLNQRICRDNGTPGLGFAVTETCDGAGVTCDDTGRTPVCGPSCDQAGLTRCVGNRVERCSGESWQLVDECSGVCNAAGPSGDEMAEAQCTEVCTGAEFGTSRCRSGRVERCNGTAWYPTDDCTARGEVCDPITVQCGAVCATENRRRCEGDILQTCNGRIFTDTQTCDPATELCDATPGLPLGEVCQPTACLPNEVDNVRCAANRRQRCEADGATFLWSDDENCGELSTCRTGNRCTSCAPSPCTTVDAKRCHGGSGIDTCVNRTIELCDQTMQTGLYFETTLCGENEACTEASGTPSCRPTCPTVGALRCGSETQLERCEGSPSVWTPVRDCGLVGSSCREDLERSIAECVPEGCGDAVGDTRCLDERVQSCLDGPLGRGWYTQNLCSLTGQSCATFDSQQAGCVSESCAGLALGTTRCAGPSRVETCTDLNGQSRWVPTDCNPNAGQVCTTVEGVATCGNESCPNPTARRCLNDYVQACTGNPRRFTNSIDCRSLGQVCSQGTDTAVCVAAECEANATRCSGSSVQVCDNGAWRTERTCLNVEACVERDGGAECRRECNQSGDVLCLDGRREISVCDGQVFLPLTECPTGLRCTSSAGAYECVAP